MTSPHTLQSQTSVFTFTQCFGGQKRFSLDAGPKWSETSQLLVVAVAMSQYGGSRSAWAPAVELPLVLDIPEIQKELLWWPLLSPEVEVTQPPMPLWWQWKKPCLCANIGLTPLLVLAYPSVETAVLPLEYPNISLDTLDSWRGNQGI